MAIILPGISAGDIAMMLKVIDAAERDYLSLKQSGLLELVDRLPDRRELDVLLSGAMAAADDLVRSSTAIAVEAAVFGPWRPVPMPNPTAIPTTATLASTRPDVARSQAESQSLSNRSGRIPYFRNKDHFVSEVFPIIQKRGYGVTKFMVCEDLSLSLLSLRARHEIEPSYMSEKTLGNYIRAYGWKNYLALVNEALDAVKANA